MTTRRHQRIPEALARELAVFCACDPRTIQKAVSRKRLSPLTAARVLPVLIARGILPNPTPQDANAEPDSSGELAGVTRLEGQWPSAVGARKTPLEL